MSFLMIKAGTSPLLAKVLQAVNYVHTDLWDEIGDPRVKKHEFLFGGGPWSTVALVSIYLYFVLSFGPRFMKTRKAYDFPRFVLFYNVAMVALNGWVFIEGLRITNYGLDSWGCKLVDYNSTDPREEAKVLVGYLFFLSKLIELADTVIFILRKKWNQVSLLHVVHHSLVPLLIWTGYKISPGGNMALFPLLNSGIHVVMYSYYGLSTLGPNVRRYLWWKQYLTTVQMIQFVIVMVHSLHVLVLPGCQFPKILLYISLTNGLLFLVLFYSFYRATYGPKGSRARLSRKNSEEKIAAAAATTELLGNGKNGAILSKSALEKFKFATNNNRLSSKKID